MATYRQELPGDLLLLLRKEHNIQSVGDFLDKHDQQLGRALETSARLPGREDELFEKHALKYDQWTNRFAIRWEPRSSPKLWRALFTEENLEALLLAGWFSPGSEMNERFRAAIDLQNVLRLRGTYEGIGRDFHFQEAVDAAAVFDTLAWSLADALRKHPETKSWSFDRTAALCQDFAHGSMEALARIGAIRLQDGWEDQMLATDQTRGGPFSESQLADSPLLVAIQQWASLILEDALSAEDAGPESPDASVI